eukprot:gene9154-9927_t
MLLVVLLFVSTVVSAREKVAVCVTGQVARWLPEQQISNLIDYNHHHFFFSFFFLFQLKDAHHPISYHKVGPTDPSKIATEQLDESISTISNLYTRKNSELGNIRFITPYKDEDWKEFFNLSSTSHYHDVDRITQFPHKNPMILNIYRNQATCLSDIIYKEKETQHQYDYVFFTREDLYYFHPLNFTIPVEKLKLQRQDKVGMTSQCHLIAKDCLGWGGINMRVEIARRSDAVTIFGSRLDFYKHLYTVNKTVVNPEAFELQQLNYHHYHVCTLPVEVLGMTVARVSASHPEGVCFFERDLVDYGGKEKCYPPDAKPKIMEMRCSDFTL